MKHLSITGKPVFRAAMPFLLMILVASLLTSFLFYPLISRGMQITSDSVKYLNKALNLRAGYGLTLRCPPQVENDTHWAPGYSVLIAAVLIFDVDWLRSCKIIAVACYLLLLTGVSFYVFKTTGSLILALLSETATGFHPNILRFSGAILSEPLSWLFLIGISGFLTVLVMKPQKKWALGLGFLLGLSMLVRYAYIPFGPICIAIFLVLCNRISWMKRITFTILISVPAVILLGSWLVRNLFLSGRAARSRPPAGSLLVNLWDGFSSWFEVLLHGQLNFLQPLLGIAIALVIVFAFKSFLSHKDQDTSAANVALLVNLLLAIGYTMGLVFLKTYRAALALNDRKFTQIILLFVLMLTFAAAAKYNRPLRRIAMGLLIFLIVLNGYLGISSFSVLRDRWLGYYEFQASPTLKFARTQGIRASRIFTSDWEAFWLWTRTCPRSFPGRKSMPKASFFQKQRARMFVWFKRTERRALLRRHNVEWDLPVTLHEFDDGYVYVIKNGAKKAVVAVAPSEEFDEPSEELEED